MNDDEITAQIIISAIICAIVVVGLVSVFIPNSEKKSIKTIDSICFPYKRASDKLIELENKRIYAVCFGEESDPEVKQKK
jgi:hypothetical protein